MYLLEAVLLITLSTSVHTDSAPVTAYVSGNGNNTVYCGTEERPCRNISYILNELHKASTSINIKVLSDIVETSKIRLHTTRPGSVGITIEGIGGEPPVLSHVWNEKLFIGGQYQANINTNITLVNMVVIMRERNNFITANYRPETLKLRMNGVTFKQTLGLGNGKTYFSGVFHLRSSRISTISIYNCSFKNFRGSRESSSLLYVVTTYNTSVTITNTSFINSSFANYMVHVVGVTSSSVHLHVSGCVFDNNSGPLLRVDSHNADMHLEKSNIINNEVKGENKGLVIMTSKAWTSPCKVKLVNVKADNNKGTVLYSIGSSGGEWMKMLLISCTFSNNKTPFSGGAITAKGGVQLVINSSTFYKNQAWIGGAISSSAFITVNSSIFTQNSAVLGGGAIATEGGSSTLNFAVQICFSEFIENDASSGGAISSNAHTIIRISRFFNNTATTGGSILLRSNIDTVKRTDTKDPGHNKIRLSEISNSIITTTTSAVDTSANLNVKNVSVKLLYQNRQVNSVKLFNHFSISGFLELEGYIMFECGYNQRLDKETTREKYKGNAQSYEPAGKVSSFFSHLSVTCNSCAKGLYNVEKTQENWTVPSGHESTINREAALDKDSTLGIKVSTSINKCHPCPRGGNCVMGPLKSRPSYWGYRKQNNQEVAFMKCPQNYCSHNSTSCSTLCFDTCSPNRQGTLCSDCVTNTSVGVFVSDCVDNNKCKYRLFYYILGSFPCLLALFVLCMIYKDTLKNLIDRLEKLLKSFKRVAKHCCCKCCKRKSEKKKLKQQKTVDNANEEGNGSSTISEILRIAAFYQVQSLLYIPNQLLHEKIASKLWGDIEHVLGWISMMNFGGGGYSVNMTKHCFPPGFTFIHRTVLNIFINVSPILLSLVILAVIYCFERMQCRDNPLKLHIQAAIICFISWFYIPVIKNLFQLVTCVVIVKDGVEVSVLFGQASQQCYNWWQVGIILLISLYLMWYFLFVYVGTRYLERKMYQQFLVMACIPVTSLYYLWKLRKDNDSNTKSFLPLPGSTLQKDSAVTEENVELEGLMSEEAQHHESSEDEHLSSMDTQQPNELTASHCEKLVGIIRDPCKYRYWPSVVFVQKFCVGFLPVVFRNDYSQTLSLMVVLFIYLLLLVKKEPYTDRILNILEPTLTSFLLLLGVLGIINTAYQSTMDNNIQNVLIIVDYLKFVVLLCPLPLWIFLIVFNKLSKSDTKDGEHDTTLQTVVIQQPTASQTTETQQAATAQTTKTLETQHDIDSYATKSEGDISAEMVKSQQDSSYQPTKSQDSADFQPIIHGHSDLMTTSFTKCSGLDADLVRSKSELSLPTKEPNRETDVINNPSQNSDEDSTNEQTSCI